MNVSFGHFAFHSHISMIVLTVQKKIKIKILIIWLLKLFKQKKKLYYINPIKLYFQFLHYNLANNIFILV